MARRTEIITEYRQAGGDWDGDGVDGDGVVIGTKYFIVSSSTTWNSLPAGLDRALWVSRVCRERKKICKVFVIFCTVCSAHL